MIFRKRSNNSLIDYCFLFTILNQVQFLLLVKFKLKNFIKKAGILKKMSNITSIRMNIQLN